LYDLVVYTVYCIRTQRITGIKNSKNNVKETKNGNHVAYRLRPEYTDLCVFLK